MKKRTFKKLALPVAAALLFGACSTSSKIKTGQEYDKGNGLKLTYFTHNPEAPKLDTGDVAVMYYKGVLDDGTEFGTNYNDSPLKFEVGTGRVIKGWDMLLPALHQGDSAMFYIPAELAYGDKKRGELIPANSNLTFYVTVGKVLQDPVPFDVAGLDTVDLGDGLKYIRVKKGTGISIQRDHKVKVNYTGYFTDGKLFDSSVGKNEAPPFELIVGRGFAIQGWDKGLVGRQRGEKGRLLVPYDLAYGKEGNPPVIPEKSDLIFDIEVMDIEVMPRPIPFSTEGKDTLKTVSGLQYIKVKKNDNKPVASGSTIVLEYTGYFTDGNIFDSSVERGDSLLITVDKTGLIPGFTEALKLMREGEKMRVIIPYNLAYGERGMPPVIPAKSDLVFDLYVRRIR